MDMSLLAAFLGGVLTLFSPCSAMLLPAFFSYAFSSPGKLLSRTGVFYLGLATTLVPWGVLAGSVGAALNQNRDVLVLIAGIVLIVMGAILVLNIPIPYLTRPRGDTTAKGSGWISVYILGAVYGVAGVCAGPLLGAVFTVAALSANPLLGAVIVLVFGAGMVLPLLILAFLWDRIPAIRKIARPKEFHIGTWRNNWLNFIAGILTIGIGALILLTDGTRNLPGLFSTSTQATLENSVFSFATAVPDWAVIVIALLLALIAWAIFALRKSEKNN